MNPKEVIDRLEADGLEILYDGSGFFVRPQDDAREASLVWWSIAGAGFMNDPANADAIADELDRRDEAALEVIRALAALVEDEGASGLDRLA